MHSIWTIARQNMLLSLQSRQAWFSLLLFPLLMIYFLGLVTQEIARTATYGINVDILDLDQTDSSRAFIQGLAQVDEYLLLCPVFNDPSDRCALGISPLTVETMQSRLSEEITFGGIVLPAGFETALMSGAPVEITFQPGAGSSGTIVSLALANQAVRMGGPALAAVLATEFSRQVGHEPGDAFFLDRLAAAQANWVEPPVVVTAEYMHPNQGLTLGQALAQNGFQLSVPAIGLMFVMIGILGLAHSLAEERASGVLVRLGVQPISKFQYLLGHSISASVLGGFQFLLMLLFGQWLGVDVVHAPGALLFIIVAFVLAISALSLFLSTLARSVEQVGILSTATWVVLIPLGGGWWPLLFVPGWLQRAGHFSPVAWAMDAINVLIYNHGTWGDIWLDGVVLVVFALLFFGLGYWRFDFFRETSLESSPTPMQMFAGKND